MHCSRACPLFVFCVCARARIARRPGFRQMGGGGRWGDVVGWNCSRVGTALVRVRILDQQKLRRRLVWPRAFKLQLR